MPTVDLGTRIHTHLELYEKKKVTTPFEAELIGLLREVMEYDVCPPGTMAKLGILEDTEPVREDFEGRLMESQYDGFCANCGVPYAEGEQVFWRGTGEGAVCVACK